VGLCPAGWPGSTTTPIRPFAEKWLKPCPRVEFPLRFSAALNAYLAHLVIPRRSSGRTGRENSSMCPVLFGWGSYHKPDRQPLACGEALVGVKNKAPELRAAIGDSALYHQGANGIHALPAETRFFPVTTLTIMRRRYWQRRGWAFSITLRRRNLIPAYLVGAEKKRLGRSSGIAGSPARLLAFDARSAISRGLVQDPSRFKRPRLASRILSVSCGAAGTFWPRPPFFVGAEILPLARTRFAPMSRKRSSAQASPVVQAISYH